MMKSSVELIMSMESCFRNMYRRLFAIETGNDFWKKVICEMTIREIQGTLDDRTEVLNDLDMKVSLAEIQCLEGYLEKYSQAVPMSVDMKWVHDEYEAFMDSDIVRKVGTNRIMGLWYGRVVSTTKFMNMTPREYRTDSDEFFRKIEKMGEAEYTQEIVNRYFLILKFDEEMRKAENKG